MKLPAKTGNPDAGPARPHRSTLPLPTLLSQVLVAFTVEFDNEAERHMPHRTTKHGVTSPASTGHASTADSLHAPWLVSLAMWSNCMQFVGERGISVCELEDLARTRTNLNGMERWGYIVVEPDPADRRPKPPRSDWIIRATAAGRKAQEVWRPLFGAIEKRWQERFGEDTITHLRESLQGLIKHINVKQPDVELPDCLPILEYGLFSRGRDRGPRTAGLVTIVVRVPLFRRFSPRFCWRSPSNSRPSRTCRWQSAPTWCAFSMRKAYGFETFRS